jgi:hypothetical protein
MDPVLIYQMGKVGSTTISTTLKSWGIENLQIHYLTEKTINNIEKQHVLRGLKVPNHVIRSRELLSDNILESKNIRMISLIRDPVKRNISAFFQNLGAFFPKVELDNLDTDTLVKTFIDKYSHNISINWFDVEFKKNTGIDLLKCIINNENDTFTIENDNLKLLLIKVEASDEVKVDSLKAFLKVNSKAELVHGNIGSEKSYSSSYSKFKEVIKLPPYYLDSMYSSPLITHFYPREKIAHMRAAWE